MGQAVNFMHVCKTLCCMILVNPRLIKIVHPRNVSSSDINQSSRNGVLAVTELLQPIKMFLLLLLSLM